MVLTSNLVFTQWAGASADDQTLTPAMLVPGSVLYLLSRSRRQGCLGARDLGEDVRGACAPDERLRVGVVPGDVQVDGQLEFGQPT